MRQGATSQLKQNQVKQNTQQTSQQQPMNLNMSQNVSASYHVTGSKRPQYFPNPQINTSFHHHHQNTGESSYQPSKQPSQKSNAQKNHNALYNQQSNQTEGARKNDMKVITSKFHSGSSGQQQHSGSRNKNYLSNAHGMNQTSQNQKNVMLSHQTPAQLSQNQSINKQLKYSTPTNIGQNQKYLINQNSKVQTKQKISPKKKKYEMTLRLLEGKIIRDYSTLLWKMSTYLTVELKKGQQQFKTQQQPGKTPKWNESFKFEVNNMGDVVKITLFNKFTFQKEDKLGYLVFSLEKLENYNTTDWFILYDDNNQQIGSVLINLTSEEINDKSEQKHAQQDSNDIDQPFSNSEEGDCDENDVDEELEQSLDYRDHEISRSLIPKNHIKGYERSLTRNGGISGQGLYKGLHTQQQHQNSASYLHTQANQPRQSVTENSVIRHYSSHSSDNHSEGGVESPNKQNRFYQKEINQKRQSNYNNTGGLITRNIKPDQQMFNPNFASGNDEEHILPQQLFHGKNQHHSNSSNNLHGIHQSNPQLQTRFINPNGNISNSQFLYLDDLTNGGVAIQNNSNAHHHQHKQHCKKQKERSSRRTKKHQHHQKDKSKKQQNIIDVEQFADEMQQNINMDGDEEDEVNYGNYLNQRSHAQVQQQQQISNSHSQQLLSALAKHNNQNYDSGGATSNSGGHQLYQLTNMGLSGSGGNGLIVGSNGSYIPSQQNIMGPSYFEDQNSIESLNEVNHQLLNAGQQNNLIMGKTYYDISELQDIEQAKLQLLEENQIINQQEQQLQQFFAQYNHNKAQLNKEIQLFQEQEKQLNEMKKNFQSQLDDFSKQKKLLSAQKKEFKYQKQQLERRFFNMKRERILISQKQKSIDDLNNQFSDLVNSSQGLKNSQISPTKVDELINLMKNIHYNLQVLNTSDKFQELDRLMQEELIYQQQQQMQGHIQQESTSSCATNSTGNYNFLLQGVHLFNNKSPLNQNSPYSMQMQQHNKQQQQLLSQQIGQSNLGVQNNLLNQRGRQNSNNHLQIGSSNLSQSSPKVITDLINTEEEVDFLDQEELFKKHSPRLVDEEEDNNNNNQYSAKQFNTQLQQSNEKQKLFLKTNKGHFLNEQHELSTIMEKELLTSQRRSSNGGAGMGTSSIIDNNYKSNQIQQQIMNNTANQYQIQAQTSSFQVPTNDLQNTNNKELEEFKEQNKIMAQKIAELEGFQKAFIEKLSYLSTLEQQMLRNANESNQSHLQSQQYSQPQQPQIYINQNDFNTNNNFQSQIHISQDEIVHITASEVPTNHNTSQVIQQQFQTNDINNTQVQQQLQQISQQQQEPISNNNDQEESMEFIPDPNFLMKINQNMQMNDGKFGQNNNQPPVKQQNNIIPINPQLFYNGSAFGGNEESGDEEYYEEVQQQQQQQQVIDNNGITQQQQQFVIDNEIEFDPNEANMMMTPEGMFVTQEQFLQMYGAQLDMQMMMNQPNMMFMDGQQQFIYDSNIPQMQLDDQIQYQDFGAVINDENDYLQNYDCGGTIKHNSNFQPQQQLQITQQTQQTQQIQIISTEQPIQSNDQQIHMKASPKQGQNQNIIQQKLRNKKEKLPEEEIQRLIDENYNYDENKEVSVIYTEDGRIYDQPKKAKHGIQPIIVKDF